MFYGSPISVSLSFTFLKLFLYTKSVVRVLYLVRVLYPVLRSPWSTVRSRSFIPTGINTAKNLKVDSNPSNNNRVLYLKDDVMFGRLDKKQQNRLKYRFLPVSESCRHKIVP